MGSEHPQHRNLPACWNRSVSPARGGTTVYAPPRPVSTGCKTASSSITNAYYRNLSPRIVTPI